MKRLFYFILFSMLLITACEKEIISESESIQTHSELFTKISDDSYILNQNSNIRASQIVEERDDEKNEMIRLIKEEMIVKESKYNYLDKLTQKYGYPLWSYAYYDSGDSENSVLRVPYVRPDGNRVSNILFASLKKGNIRFEYISAEKTEKKFNKKNKENWENLNVSVLSYLSADYEIFEYINEEYAQYIEGLKNQTNSRDCHIISVCNLVYPNYAIAYSESSFRDGVYICTNYVTCSSPTGWGDCMSCGDNGDSGDSNGGSNNGGVIVNHNYLPDEDGLTFSQKLSNFSTMYELNSAQENYLENRPTLLHDLYEAHNFSDDALERAEYIYDTHEDYNPVLDLIKYEVECAFLKAKYPHWKPWKISLNAWLNVKIGQIHTALDVLGAIPGYGEPADLVNGIIYVIEGDGYNAAISFGSAVVFGEVIKSSKYAAIAIKHFGLKHNLRIIKESNLIKFVDENGNVVLTEFKGRKELRKILNIRSSTYEAHHLIPWQFWDHPAIQKAALDPNKPFHMNHHKNGVKLKKFRKNLDNQGVHANHPKYNKEVERRLNALNLNDPKLSEKIIGIQNDLRSFIENNEGIKLNDLYN